MSILIKGIDMPEDYVDIRFFADGTVKSYKHNGLDVKTQKNAVVEVPTPHGRLIDADALLDKKQDYGEGQQKLMLIDPYFVRNASAVIEAEEE